MACIEGAYRNIPNKNLGCQGSIGLTGQKHSTHVAGFCHLKRCAFCYPLWEREHKKACTMVPPDSPCAFVHSDPVVHPYSFTVINLSIECSYILTPNVAWPEGHPTHIMGDTGAEYLTAVLYEPTHSFCQYPQSYLWFTPHILQF